MGIGAHTGHSGPKILSLLVTITVKEGIVSSWLCTSNTLRIRKKKRTCHLDELDELDEDLDLDSDDDDYNSTINNNSTYLYDLPSNGTFSPRKAPLILFLKYFSLKNRVNRLRKHHTLLLASECATKGWQWDVKIHGRRCRIWQHRSRNMQRLLRLLPNGAHSFSLRAPRTSDTSTTKLGAERQKKQNVHLLSSEVVSFGLDVAYVVHS